MSRTPGVVSPQSTHRRGWALETQNGAPERQHRITGRASSWPRPIRHDSACGSRVFALISRSFVPHRVPGSPDADRGRRDWWPDATKLHTAVDRPASRDTSPSSSCRAGAGALPGGSIYVPVRVAWAGCADGDGGEVQEHLARERVVGWVQWRQAGSDLHQVVAVGEAVEHRLDRVLAVVIGRTAPSHAEARATTPRSRAFSSVTVASCMRPIGRRGPSVRRSVRRKAASCSDPATTTERSFPVRR